MAFEVMKDHRITERNGCPFVFSRFETLGVIPAEAGIQVFKLFWTPAFAGVTVWK